MTQHHPPIAHDGWVVPFMTTIRPNYCGTGTGTGYGNGTGWGDGNGNGDGDGDGYGDGHGTFARCSDDPLEALTTLS